MSEPTYTVAGLSSRELALLRAAIDEWRNATERAKTTFWKHEHAREEEVPPLPSESELEVVWRKLKVDR